jgi:hypothetical protein
MYNVAPLPASFAVASILGLFVSSMWISKFSANWAFAFSIVFLILLVASLISMSYAEPENQLRAKPIR